MQNILNNLFPHIFSIFEVCSSSDLVDFLVVCSIGDFEGISELKIHAISEMKKTLWGNQTFALIYLGTLLLTCRPSCTNKLEGTPGTKKTGVLRAFH